MRPSARSTGLLRTRTQNFAGTAAVARIPSLEIHGWAWQPPVDKLASHQSPQLIIKRLAGCRNQMMGSGARLTQAALCAWRYKRKPVAFFASLVRYFPPTLVGGRIKAPEVRGEATQS